MAVCKNCGQENAADAAFCINCGSAITSDTPVEATPVEPTQTQNTPVEPAQAQGTPVEPVQAQGTPVQATPQQSESQNGNKFEMPNINITDKLKNIEIPSEYADRLKENKKPLAIIAGAAAGVLLLIIILCVALGGNGPESLIKKSVKASNKEKMSFNDVLAMNMNTYSNAVEEEVAKIRYSKDYGEFNEDIESLKEYVEEYADDYADGMEDYYGDDWKITYDIKRVKKFDKDDDEFEECEDRWESYVESLEDSAEYYEDLADDEDDDDRAEMYEKLAKVYDKYAKKYDKKDVTAVREVKVKYTIKGDDEKESHTNEITFAKVGGKWVKLGY